MEEMSPPAKKLDPSKCGVCHSPSQARRLLFFRNEQTLRRQITCYEIGNGILTSSPRSPCCSWGLVVCNSGCSTGVPLLFYIIGSVYFVAHLQNSFNPLASCLQGIVSIISYINYVVHLQNSFNPLASSLKWIVQNGVYFPPRRD